MISLSNVFLIITLSFLIFKELTQISITVIHFLGQYKTSIMKYLCLFFLLGLLVGCGNMSSNSVEKKKLKQEVLSSDMITMVGERAFLKNNPAGFSGVVVDRYLNDSLKSKRTFKNGFLNGFWREWNENGLLTYELNYKFGKANGMHREWHSNGQLSCEWSCLDGQRQGVGRRWYDDGQLRSTTNYKDGKGVLEKTYFKNGNMKNECNYSDGKSLDGLWRQYYENGQLEAEVNYKEGKKDGLWKQYYKNGQLGAEGNWKVESVA